MSEPPVAADRAATVLALIDQIAAELRPSASPRAHLDSRLDKDLGLDSLARVELLARVERSFGCRLDEALLGSAETPRDLLAALHGGDSIGGARVREGHAGPDGHRVHTPDDCSGRAPLVRCG